MFALQTLWKDFFRGNRSEDDWWLRLEKVYNKRNITVLRIEGIVKDWRVIQRSDRTTQKYTLKLTFILKQKNHIYIEEREYPFEFYEQAGEIKEHRQTQAYSQVTDDSPLSFHRTEESTRQRAYDRRKAVQYAERWWNDYNPAFKVFEVDCTNYISQCLLAGGGWMHGEPNREKGWWYSGDTWSFSWSVAHSMRWYLSGATNSIVGTEVDDAEQLQLGDVICYDFEGDGRWDHTTIVVAKDGNNMPLVNAHTDNSRHRYWSYEDSTAWTPNIAYKFYNIQVH